MATYALLVKTPVNGLRELVNFEFFSLETNIAHCPHNSTFARSKENWEFGELRAFIGATYTSSAPPNEFPRDSESLTNYR